MSERPRTWDTSSSSGGVQIARSPPHPSGSSARPGHGATPNGGRGDPYAGGRGGIGAGRGGRGRGDFGGRGCVTTVASTADPRFTEDSQHHTTAFFDRPPLFVFSRLFSRCLQRNIRVQIFAKIARDERRGGRTLLCCRRVMRHVTSDPLQG